MSTHKYHQNHPFLSLQNHNWRTLWIAGHCWHMVFWMNLIIMGWLMLEITDSPILVSLVGTFFFLPSGIFGIFAGVQADQMSKKRMLIFAQIINLIATFVFITLLLLREIYPWEIYLLAISVGLVLSIDFPVRRALIRDILPENFVVNAMAIDAASLAGTAMLGRWIAGFLTSIGGPLLGYSCISLFLIVAFILLLKIPDHTQRNTSKITINNTLKYLREGISYVWRNQGLRGTMLITIILNILSFSYISMLPIFARDVFGGGPSLLGLMSGMEGLGALTATLVIAYIDAKKHLGTTFMLGAGLCSTGILLFSMSNSLVIAMPMLIIAGLGIGAFATMQTTIPTTLSTPSMRGRAMGAITLAIGIALPLGTIYMGILAQLVKAPIAVAFSSSIGIATLLCASMLLPGLRKI